MDKIEQLLTALIPAILSIDSKCPVCIESFVDRVNSAIEKLDLEYLYLFDYEKEDEVSLCITDGFGNYYPVRCKKCGLKNYVVRPGKFQCPNGCERE